MRFEARDLKLSAEPVSPDDLRQGEVYFGLLFLDDDGFVPVLEPKVFIGRDLDSGDKNKIYFQDFASYRRGVRYNSKSSEDEAVFEVGAENHVYDYEQALDCLLVCSLRRKKAANRGGAS